MMYFDKFKLRDMNERIVLEALITNQPVSRIELSKITRLNKASITNIVNALIKKSLIVEVGYGESQNTGGPRPILLELNKNAGYALSIDVGNNYLEAIITDLNGSVVNSISYRENGFTVDDSNIFDRIDDIVVTFEKESKKTNYGIVSMVLAIHGVVVDNHILVTPNYNLIGLGLHEKLNAKYEFPVFLENEANLAILGQISSEHEITNALLLSIHTGIGAGIIINRELYTGTNGAAGEVGHLTLYPNGKQCRCGRKGCFEQYCSSKLIYDKFNELFPNEILNEKNLNDKYEFNNTFKNFINQTVFDLSIGIQSIVAAYDPDIIYIISEVLTALPFLKNDIQEILNDSFNRKIPIVLSNIKHGAILIGGASLGISEFLGIQGFLLNKEQL